MKQHHPIGLAYGHLIVQHQKAARSGDEPLRLRIFAATELFSELWPEETAAWEAACSAKVS